MAAERNSDDIAAALHGLSAGESEHAEEHHDAPEHVEEAAPAPAPPPAPPVPRETAKPRAASPTSSKRPSSPVARPAAPTAAPAPAPKPAQAHASAPRARPASPVRPAAPTTVAEAEPSPPIEQVETVAPVRKTPISRTLNFRRTVIPVLLTTGVMMLVIGAARWFVDEESALARLPIWVVGVVIGAGILFILLAVLNMLFVHGEIAKSAATSPR